MSFSPGTLFCSPLSYRALSLGISSCSTATISFGKGTEGTAVSKTEPGQVWHQAQAVGNEWTMTPGSEEWLVPWIAQNSVAEEALIHHRELKNKCWTVVWVTIHWQYLPEAAWDYKSACERRELEFEEPLGCFEKQNWTQPKMYKAPRASKREWGHVLTGPEWNYPSFI